VIAEIGQGKTVAGNCHLEKKEGARLSNKIFYEKEGSSK